MSLPHQHWLPLEQGGDTQAAPSNECFPAPEDPRGSTDDDHVDTSKDGGQTQEEDDESLHFFSLRANNMLALQVLCSLQELISRQPLDPEYERTARFTRILPPQSAAALLGLPPTDSSPASSFSTDSPHPLGLDHTVHCASFRVTLALLPRYKPLGWILGSDPSKADLLLPDKSKCNSQHVAVTFHKNGQPMLRALRPHVSLDGHALAKGEIRSLNGRSHLVRIRNLEFALSIDRSSAHEDAFRRALAAYGEELGMHLHSALSATPQQHPYRIGPYDVNSVVAVGSIQLTTEGKTVIQAVRHMKTGEAYALKTRKRVDRASWNDVTAEIGIYEAITASMPASHGRHDFVMRLHEVLEPAEERSLLSYIHLVFDPLASSDLHKAVARLSQEERVVILIQTLMGIQWLHAQGWMHRDIKPGNIGVLDSPCRAVILDLGQAVNITHSLGCIPTPGFGGTKGYLAPEQENIQYCDPRRPERRYDYKVDVFALGIVAMDHLSLEPPTAAPGKEPSQTSDKWARVPNPFIHDHADGVHLAQYFEIMRKLDAFPKASQQNWIAGMLRLYPQDRLSAEESLDHIAIRQLVQREDVELSLLNEQDAAPGSKRGDQPTTNDARFEMSKR